MSRDFIASSRRLRLGITLGAVLLAVPFATHAQETPLSRTTTDSALKWGPCPEFMPKGCEIAVLHGDPAKSNADVFFKVPARAEIPRHWHTSAERMMLASGELTVAYDGHPAVVLRPGSYAYGPARLPHTATCGSAGPCVLFIAFESPVDAMAGGPAER